MPEEDPNEGPKKSVELAQDITKLVLSLTTGVLALSLTFAKETLKTPPHSTWLLFVSWATFGISLAGGFFALSSMVNLLHQKKFDPYAKATCVPAILQLFFFVIAFVFMGVFFGLNI